MLTIRENLLETIRGGNPDRFVNQYEFLDLIRGTPVSGKFPPIGGEILDPWGVTMRWSLGQPGPFPVHEPGKKVLNDITKWKDVLKMPQTSFPDSAWQPFVDAANSVNRKEKFVTAMFAPGLFERIHFLMGMEDALISFYEEPETMHELINYLTEYEINYAKETIKYIHPDALFHHDDWGSSKSTFLSPEMFNEFILPAYKKIYGYWKENGVELIVHHSDCYAATLVPQMIEMGMDIWQGCMSTNNIPELIKQYEGKISFMGNLDNGRLDKEEWSREEISLAVRESCNECGKLYYIPCLIIGGPSSSYPGVYDTISEEINKINEEI